MAKERTSVSINGDILARARSFGINTSQLLESAIEKRIDPKKSHMKEDLIMLKCPRCQEIVNDGYLCEITDNFHCVKCEKVLKCLPKDHEHIRIPGYEGQNIKRINKVNPDVLPITTLPQ